jgi:hypothetical protein
LFLGVAVGAWGVIGFTPGGLIAAVASTFEKYVKNSLLHPEHATVILFTLMTAGMIGILARNGGISGLVGVLTRWAYTPRRGMLCSTGLGLSIFFDDYATTLLVGKTMRPITDRLKISREKLAYIVDSTAAPLACIAFVTTWVGFQISLIGSSLADLPGLDLTASSILISAIGPLNRDAILALRGVQGQHRRWCFTYQGNRMEAIGSAWKRALRRAGIDKFRFHDLRHTWASWHVMSGTSLQELMELGGWKSYEMVLRYAHLAPEHLSTAAARIERELEVVTTGATISLR